MNIRPPIDTVPTIRRMPSGYERDRDLGRPIMRAVLVVGGVIVALWIAIARVVQL